RHTRFSRDWSSDVCSSDLLFMCFRQQLIGDARVVGDFTAAPILQHEIETAAGTESGNRRGIEDHHQRFLDVPENAAELCEHAVEIGRASCRERGWISWAGV